MKFKADNAPHALRVGQAGVYRILSELMLRGMNAYLPVVDVGVDLILENNLRIQIKAANLRTQTMKNRKDKVPYEYGPAYFWSLNSSQLGAKHKYVKRPNKYSSQVDYMVLWGIDEDRFWIIPSKILDEAGIIALFPKDHNKTLKSRRNKEIYTYEDRWDLISDPSTEASRPETEPDEFDISYGAVPLFALHSEGVM